MSPGKPDRNIRPEVDAEEGSVCFVFVFCVFVFLGLYLQHIEVPGLGV